MSRSRWWRAARWTGLGVLVVAVAIQLVPYGRSHLAMDDDGGGRDGGGEDDDDGN